jgi:phospholipase/lecithinase/hemolysin
MRKQFRWAPLAGASFFALTLTACGGGGGDTTPSMSVSSVKVMGDSLADSGTFGYKFTVQGADSKVYPEIVATSYGVGPLCNFYSSTGTTFAPNTTKAGCTNYAVGGGRINNFSAPTAPLSIIQQLKDAAAAGSYAPGDLLIIDGGGNDAADLVGAFLNASTDSAASYAALLQTMLQPAAVGAALATGQAGLESIGATYMTALADTFYSTIKTTTLDKGAQHVLVLNMPGVTNTPRFQMVLDGIAAAAGGGATGAGARAHYEGVFKGWIVAFNTELAAKFAGNGNVVLVDFYTSFNDQIATPAQFGLQNATLPACPVAGVGSDHLPVYDFPTCTDVALSAMTPPAGATGGANWWKSFAFADGFHPTPYGHKLLAQLISRSLSQAGWL